MPKSLAQWSGFIATIMVCFVISFLAVGYARQRWMGPSLSANVEPAVVTGDFRQHFNNASADIVIYGTASCVHCQNARAYFQSRQISFLDRRIDTDASARRAFDSLARRTVPQIIIHKQLIGGFNPAVIADALKQTR